MGKARHVPRLVWLALLAALVAVVVVAAAAGDRPRCTDGVSSAGPVVLVHGHLDPRHSELTPHAQACLRR
jgi:hypothetical protein